MKNRSRRGVLLISVLASCVLFAAVNLEAQGACLPQPRGVADWWPGDGNASDMQGPHNGVVQGGLTFAPGFVGPAFTFDGAGAAVKFGQAGDFGTSDFTVDFWLSTTSDNEDAVIEKRASCSHGQFYGIRTDRWRTGHLVVETDDGLGNYVNISTNRAINNGAFYLIALVRQGTTTSVYIDGVLDSAMSTLAVANVSNSASLSAGESICDHLDGTVPLTGQLDEIQAFARALSAAEIKAIYEAGSAGQCKNVLLSPTALSFAPAYPRLVGVGGPFRPVILTNNGTADLTISKIMSGAEFPRVHNCSASLAPGASCTIQVGFKPKDKGTRTGTLYVADNAAGSPHRVSLSGRATYVGVSVRGLNFGDQGVGTTSAAQKITLTNTAPTALTFTGIQLAGRQPQDFAQTNDCGTGLAPGASCTISVTFSPTALGLRRVTAVINDDGGSSPQKVCLQGYGT